MIEKIKKQILESVTVKENMAEACVADMEAVAIIMISCIKNGGKSCGAVMAGVPAMLSTCQLNSWAV